ncbi:sugar phosphate isomerase/epimerase family protein [Enterobacillus tribolii]|uniref:Sugar phosphate isomerase/epimerase n=1 Tax=Enterobacillus tribolii TaxID=1487935 RepID=A0A370QE43_9GAMM|nr:sugar phosphate isomerase/epimerase [Enterobacillus tribolii]MBW7984229.1 sugar phosphate isomerase/epimerase [Enterobacillus tribolii]RDK86632.1 hypothetical protein C8D90_11116 [Enterobacillus tribolii]
MHQEIVVVTAAYGWDTVKRLGGQAALLPVIAASGADGVEIRRELMDEQDLAALPALARQIEALNLFAVYSVPEGLFDEAGNLNAHLAARLEEAAQLKARVIKFSLGHYRPGFNFTGLSARLAQSPVQLVVENDQTPDCGILSPLNAFFAAVNDCHCPIRMTFDMANWHWVGQDAVQAAQTLGDTVGYIHVKAACRNDKGWCAVELDNSDGSWKPLLEMLPGNVMRGIEFPLQGDDLTAVTRHYVNLLRAH